MLGESFGLRVGEEAAKPAPQIENFAQPAQPAVASPGCDPLVLLNTASREELMKIRGIGPILADRIIRARPFTSTEQVAERGILPANVLKELKRESKSA